MAGRNQLQLALVDQLGIEIIESLLADGANVNTENEKGETALYLAVENNSDLGVIQALVMAGGDVNCRINGNTLLHEVGSVEVAKELLSCGVSVNETNKDGETPLQIAVNKNRGIELIESLLVAGANVNAENVKGENALYCAVENNSDLGVIKALVMAGGDVNCRVKQNIEVEDEHVEITNRGDDWYSWDEMDCYITYGEDVLTPLHIAVKERRPIELIECLLAAGADVNATNMYMETPLFSAVSCSDMRVIKALVIAGGDVNCKNSYGSSLLHVAGSVEVAKELLSLGLSVDVSNYLFMTPLLSAVHMKRGIELIECLLAAGADVNAVDEDYHNSLYTAILDEDIRLIKALLKAGGEVGSLDYSSNEQSLLHIVHNGKEAKLILSHGLYVDVVDEDGLTPLGYIATRFRDFFYPSDHELYFNMDSQIYDNEVGFCTCSYCKCKDLAWTFVLHGAVVRREENSPLDIVLMGDSTLGAEFFMKAELINRYFDGLEGTIDLSSYRSYLSRFKNRFKSDLDYIDFYQFPENCVNEIVHMKCDMISDNYSLYDFFFKCEKDNKIIQLYPRSDNLEKEISIKYPIYRELLLPKIVASIKRSVLFDKLKGLTIYVKKSGIEKISLKYYILREIAVYLSFNDLTNVINCAMDE